MPDNVFADTNVLIYFISAEEGKKIKAKRSNLFEPGGLYQFTGNK